VMIEFGIEYLFNAHAEKAHTKTIQRLIRASWFIAIFVPVIIFEIYQRNGQESRFLALKH
ncbi:MAG: hypothetical protein R6X07_06545, partial [Desulfatiglandales bacterium]